MTTPLNVSEDLDPVLDRDILEDPELLAIYHETSGEPLSERESKVRAALAWLFPVTNGRQP
jgi:hypothetical protein